MCTMGTVGFGIFICIEFKIGGVSYKFSHYTLIYFLHATFQVLKRVSMETVVCSTAARMGKTTILVLAKIRPLLLVNELVTHYTGES